MYKHVNMCGCLLNSKDAHFEKQEGDVTSLSAAEQLSSWQHNTAVVPGSSQVCVDVCVWCVRVCVCACVSNTPFPSTTPTGFCSK